MKIEIIKNQNKEQELFQWDTDRKLKVLTDDDITVDEVHFSNAFTQQALIVVPTADVDLGCMVADIPNILLQYFIPIDVYVVMYSEKGERTVYTQRLEIIKRAKPSDYVYTETELLSWDMLERQIKELKENMPTKTSDLENDSGFTTQETVDKSLENYVKDTDYATDTQAGVVKVKRANGIGLDGKNALLLDSPNEYELKNKSTINAPLKPNMIDKIVKYGLTDNQLEWTDEEKKVVAGLIGVRAALADTLVRRYSSGGIQVPEVPTDDTHAASKKYVDEKIFMAEYGVTTYDEVKQAYEQGKQIYCKKDNYISALSYVETIYNNDTPVYFFEFTCINSNSNRIYKIGSAIAWTEVIIDYANWISGIDETVININKQMPSLLASVLKFQTEEIQVGESFYIEKPGLYLVSGYDYDLKLNGVNNATLGSHDDNLLVALFVSELGTEKVAFYGKTYKSLGISSAESGVLSWLDSVTGTNLPHVTNTNSSNPARVFYLATK